MSNSIVIIPTYNERENVLLMANAVLALEEPFNILFVDDNSPDGTAEIISGIMETHPNRVFMINRAGKLGLGTAYIAGFKWALSKDYAFIFEMDCDFSHDPADLIRLKRPVRMVPLSQLALGIVRGERLKTGLLAGGCCLTLPTSMCDWFCGLGYTTPPQDSNVTQTKHFNPLI